MSGLHRFIINVQRIPRSIDQVRKGRTPKDFNGRPLDPEPTQALPGTPEKVLILIYRRMWGLSLWHPDDAVLQDAGRLAYFGRLDNFGGLTVSETVEESDTGVIIKSTYAPAIPQPVPMTRGA